MIFYHSGSGFMFKDGPVEAEHLNPSSIMMTFWEIRGGLKGQVKRFQQIVGERDARSNQANVGRRAATGRDR